MSFVIRDLKNPDGIILLIVVFVLLWGCLVFGQREEITMSGVVVRHKFTKEQLFVIQCSEKKCKARRLDGTLETYHILEFEIPEERP